MGTIDYYNENAGNFCDSTFNLDLSNIHSRFLSYIPPQGKILDAGCGSGRDSLAFMEAGYDVTAFDASFEMVKRTSRYSIRTFHMKFEELDMKNKFDGIWACASLLHVHRHNFSDVLSRLADSLKHGGVMYASFKYGNGERFDGSRTFLDMNENMFVKSIGYLFEISDTWITRDLRINRATEKWFNVIVKKVDA